ncbi:hypothetical protein EDB83DRAFT_854088 [Lactarius deliciosus]|nr:hypothetical protein EDB83DRAFT_854088 [Lactarius deliciosus]
MVDPDCQRLLRVLRSPWRGRRLCSFSRKPFSLKACVLLLIAITLDHPYVDCSDAKRTQVAKDVTASQDALVDIFERIESFFRRLEEYSEVRTTEAMRGIVVKITVEVLGIFGIVTKEMKQGRAKRCQLEEGISKTRSADWIIDATGGADCDCADAEKRTSYQGRMEAVGDKDNVAIEGRVRGRRSRC